MSSNSRRICVIRWRWPRRAASPGMVTSTRSSVSRLSSSARLSSSSRASIADSIRSRSAFSVMPVSRSRTSRSASFSSLLRPRYSTRACSISSTVSAAATALSASDSTSCASTAATVPRSISSLCIVPPLACSLGRGAPAREVEERRERLGARRCPGSEPGLDKQRGAVDCRHVPRVAQLSRGDNVSTAGCCLERASGPSSRGPGTETRAGTHPRTRRRGPGIRRGRGLRSRARRPARRRERGSRWD